MIIISTADLKYSESIYILAVKATKTIVVQTSNSLQLFFAMGEVHFIINSKFQGRKKLLDTESVLAGNAFYSSQR